MSRMLVGKWMMLLLLGLACGLAGWAGGRASAARAATDARRAAADTPSPHTLFAPAPTIAVASDGRVTLHVDGEPLAWVLAEIDRQKGAHVDAAIDVSAPAGRLADSRLAPCAGAPAAPAEPASEIVARVMRGTEAERYATLAQSQNSGAVSEDMLKTLYTTDASPRIRLLAFEYAQEGTEDDPAARRAELEAARLLPDAVVAREAARRLDAMDAQARRAAPQAAAPH